MKRAVFFDRDGVLNKALVYYGRPYSPRRLEEVELTEQAPRVVEYLKSQGFLAIGITNQPDVARRKMLIDDAEEINRFIQDAVGLDRLYCCYHDDSDNCLCRKPKPGLFFKAANDFQIDLQQSFAIGDRWRDIEAANTAGVKSVFIELSYNEKKPTTQDATVTTLNDALNWIIKGIDER